MVVAINLVFVGFWLSQFSGKATYRVEKAKIIKVIDGDTIETSLGKVRLLGINSPEKGEKGYKEAKNFLSQFEGEEAELISLGENKDQYGRLLRYVFCGDRFLNKEVLEKGLGHVYFYEKDGFINELKKAEEKARRGGVGMWERSKKKCSRCVVLVELNSVDPGEYVLLKNVCQFNCSLINWTIKDDANHKRMLNFSLSKEETRKINYKGRVWNDDHDTLYLYDDSGYLVLWHRYGV